MVECVPNFSEGRRPETIEEIAATVVAAGASLLDVSCDVDHHRSVITYAGAAPAVAQASIQAAGVALRQIDVSTHQGVHPRMGALDVLPFVPLEGSSMHECRELASSTGAEIWERYRIPIFFYGEAARRPECQNLSALRSAVIHDPFLRPDIGDPGPHPTAGATAVGVRKILIAFNVNLNSANVSIARQVAAKVRESSGGLRAVKALGFFLKSRNLAQVSMNLTDFEVTGIRAAFDAVRSEAAKLGAEVVESELVGLAPRAALDADTARHVLLRDFGALRILENRLAGMAR